MNRQRLEALCVAKPIKIGFKNRDSRLRMKRIIKRKGRHIVIFWVKI
jgi:hypothetical protein